MSSPNLHETSSLGRQSSSINITTGQPLRLAIKSNIISKMNPPNEQPKSAEREGGCYSCVNHPQSISQLLNPEHPPEAKIRRPQGGIEANGGQSIAVNDTE